MQELERFQTPMMQQYARIKQEYPDAILFFRLGDFYEMFLEDAQIGSQILGITLTSRHKGKDGRIPMAGVPYHSADSYIAKLVREGYKVAVCEQVSNPAEPGLVEREVVRVVTPGTLLDEKYLEQDSNCYLMSLHLESETLGVAVADLGTGDYRATQVPETELVNEIERFHPRELILSPQDYQNPRVLKEIKGLGVANIYEFKGWPDSYSDAVLHLSSFYDVETLEGFGLEGKPAATIAATALLKYLQETQKGRVGHLRNLFYYHNGEFLVLDATTIRNLELFSPLRGNGQSASLWRVLNHTQTAMGGRRLRSWILRPLLDARKINLRLDAVEWLVQNRELCLRLRQELSKVRDVERLLSRLSVGTGNARDLVGLVESLLAVREVAGFLPSRGRVGLIKLLRGKLSSSKLVEVIELIERAIDSDPPATVHEGGIIADGFSPELDELRQVARGGKEWLARLEEQERKRSGIENLKVGFNRVYGYYLEVPKTKVNLVPQDFIRKQTLANTERFITPKLKEYEERVLTAEEQARELEYRLFCQVVEDVLRFLEALQEVAEAVAQLDVLASFAYLAEKNHYARPKILAKSSTGTLRIKEGRHPVVEELRRKQQFVPNDTWLDKGKNQVHIVTGANMAGKSTYIRQVALIVLMAQMGSFVPAKEAQISLVDRIFARIGASDQLAGGLSTFMVEMVETAKILNHATDNSLIILDEVGRGTSTYDGISIAWSVAEHLALNTNTKTLFATHYHELTELENQLENVRNYSLAVAEDEVSGEVVFLYQVKPGGASKSYGIEVARKAGLPENILRRAREILSHLEKQRIQHAQRKKLRELPLFASE